MEKLITINDLATEYNLSRTITNFNFIDKHNLFTFITNDLCEKTEYNKLKIGNIEDISCLIYCNTHQKIISFVNPINIEYDKDKRVDNVSIVSTQRSKNTDKIIDFMIHYNDVFSKYMRKKKIKSKKSFTMMKQNQTNNTITKYESKYIHKTVTLDAHNILITTKLICHIISERIELVGRIMLPNSITIILKNKSRIILYKKGKISVILTRNDDLRNLLKIIDSVLKAIHDIYINEGTLNMDDISIYFDFVYNTIESHSIIPKSYSNIRFISNNKIILHNVDSIDKLESCIKQIKVLEKEHWPSIENYINDIDPFKCSNNEIDIIIQKISNL